MLLQAEGLLNRLFPQRKINKVLLVNPPDADSSLFRYETAKRHRYTNYPPYGLTVLAQNLIMIGVDVRISNLNYYVLKCCIESFSPEEFDFDMAWQRKLSNDISEFKPDTIGVSCMFSMTYPSFRNVCNYLASYDIPLAAGGVYVTGEINKTLTDIPCIDIAFLGEGDVAFRNFIQVVNGNIGAKNLSQVILNFEGTHYSYLKDSVPSSKDISIIPAYNLLEISNYSRYGTVGAFYCFKPSNSRIATVLSNRGCRARCTYCSVRNFNGPGVRQRDISSVVDEMELLQNTYGIDHIMWLDDDLFFNHRRAVSLFNEMVRRKLRLTWDATNGVMALSCKDEVIAAAAESGCIALNIGMESGNPAILHEIRKPANVETYLKAAAVLNTYEQIHSSVFLMIGFPNETMSMVFDTINLAKQMNLDWYRISILEPLPNTPLYDSMVAQGLIKEAKTDELRFMGGAYGKQTEIEQGFRLGTPNFKKAFSSIPLDAVPRPEQLTDVWFYMNYHLNFCRLLGESRKVKIEQQILHLKTLSDVISPENGFALYFLGYLQYKTKGSIEPEIIDRLRKRLSTSPYWMDRLGAFGLSISDLEKADFLEKERTVGVQ